MQYIYFTADWCAPCRQLKPLIASSGKPIQVVDIETNPDLKTKYSIMSVPTLIGLNGGNVAERYSGVAQIMSFLNKQ